MPDNFDTAIARREWNTAVPQKEIKFWPDAATQKAFDSIKEVSPNATLPEQKAKLDLVVHAIMAKATESDPITIWVSLEHSAISSGVMLYDEDDRRGFFQDRVIVEMWLEQPDGSARPDFRRVADGPATVNGSGSTTSSVSFSFSASLSANAGFFGDTPTGGVGASGSVSVSQSHSFSKSLTDFQAINESDQHRAKHTYQMSQSSGGAYRKAIDLVPSGEDIGFTNALKGIKLHHPPNLATSNLPLISQCVWQRTQPGDVAEDLVARIEVTQRVVLVEGRNNVVNVTQESWGRTLRYVHRETLKLGELIAPPAPKPF